MFELTMGTDVLKGVLDKTGELHWEAYSVAHMFNYKGVYQFAHNKHSFAMHMPLAKEVRVITHARLMFLLKRSKTHKETYEQFNGGLMFVRNAAAADATTTPVRCIEQCSEEEPDAKLFDTWLNELRAELTAPRVVLKRRAPSPTIRCSLYKMSRPDSPPLPRYPFAVPPPASPPRYTPASPPPPASPPRYTPASPPSPMDSHKYTPASPPLPASPPRYTPASPPSPMDSPKYTPASPSYEPPSPRDSPKYTPPSPRDSPGYLPTSPSFVPPSPPRHSPSFVPPRCVPTSPAYPPPRSPDDDSPCHAPHRDSPPARRRTSPPPPRNYTPMARRCTSAAPRARRYLAPSPQSPPSGPASSPVPALGLSMWMDSVPPTKIFIFTGSRVQTFVPQE